MAYCFQGKKGRREHRTPLHWGKKEEKKADPILQRGGGEGRKQKDLTNATEVEEKIFYLTPRKVPQKGEIKVSHEKERKSKGISE